MTPTLHLDASVLYALVRLGGWPGLEADDLQAARQALLQASVSELPERMRQLAATGMPDAIVPFRRDPLDVAFAAVLADVIVPAEFGTEGTLVDAGYFQFTGSKVTYVDEVCQGRSCHEARLLDPPAVRSALNALDALRNLPREPMRYEVPGNDDALHLHGPLLAPCLLGEADEKSPTVKLWLVRPSLRPSALPSMRPSKRPPQDPTPQGEAPCEFRGNTLAMRRLRPEWLMELQAASLSGAWLQLTSRHFSCLGPLPDLLEPGSSQPVRFHMGAVLESGFGAMPAASVALDAHTALRIVRHVPWAWMHEPADFAAAAAHFLEGAPEP